MSETNEDPGDPKVLVRVKNERDAAMIIGALQDQGIRAEAVGAAIAGFRAEVPADVAIVVRAKQLADAQAALREIQGDPGDVDWSKVDVGEPE